MLDNLPLNRTVVIDVETVPAQAGLDSLPDRMKELWEHKAMRLADNPEDPDAIERSYFDKAALFPEFGKIICISMGVFQTEGDQYNFRIKSFFGHNEEQLLKEFKELLNKHFSSGSHFMCAHNGKSFDFPYIIKRCLINGLDIPEMLQITGKKPWETGHLIDTLSLWQFGDFKSYVSLDLLAAVLNIDSPKDDIKGSEVGKVYWYDNDIRRIVDYCQKDIVTLARILMRLKHLEPITEKAIAYTENMET